MKRVLRLLLFLGLSGVLWIFRPVPTERADTVDWEIFKAQLDGPEVPLTSQTNVVLAVVCTLRKDRVEPYGHIAPTSPFLDALAGDGVVLDRHYTQAPWTRPSMGSLLTGRWPRGLKLDNPGKRSSLSLVLGDQHTTLAEHFTEAGYATIGSTGNPNLKAQFGLSQGLQRFWEPAKTYKEGNVEVEGHAQVDFLLDELAKTPSEQPVYMQVVLTDTHTPRTPALRYLRMFTWKSDRLAEYDAAVRQADAVLARLFVEFKDLRPDTLFVVANDHGEGLRLPRGHGKGHGNHLYTTTIGGASIWHHPALPQHRTDALTMNIDVAPTVLGAVGLPAGDFDGEDLSRGLLKEGPFPEREFVFSETYYGKSRKQSVIGPQHQYILDQRKAEGSDGSEMLFDVEDILSRNNIIADHPLAADRLRAALTAWDSKMSEQWNQAGALEELELSEDTKAQLEALGYIE